MLTGALFASAAVAGVAAPALAASATVSVPEVPRAGATVTVTGTGFSTADYGIYLGLRADGATADVSGTTVWIDDENVDGDIPGLGKTAPMAADGSFSVQVGVPAFSEGVSYSIVTRKAHGLADPGLTQSTTTPVVYEAAPAVSTTTTLSVSPSSAVTSGDAVTLTAGVSPSDAVGSVEFLDGTTSLGVASLSGGSASASTSSLSVGQHQVTAVFTPTDSGAFAGSTSAAQTITVSADTTPQQPVPVLSVSETSGLDPDGATITVTGENYDTSATSAYGPGGKAGVYAQIGWLDSTWRPSQGAVSANRSNAYSVWVQGVNETAPYLKWSDNGDGTADFTWTVTIDKATLDAKSRAGATLAVFTVGAGGAVQAVNELSVPISFAVPQPVPAITVSPSTDLDPSVTNVVTVEGTGFTGAGAVNGAYVLLGETSLWHGEGPLPGEGWLAQAWVQPAQITDGAFTTTLTIPAGTLDPSKQYQVATSAAHALSATDRSLDAFAPVTVSALSGGPAVSFGLAGNTVQQGGTLEVIGTGFESGALVEAVAHSEPVKIGEATADALGTVRFEWTVPSDFETGIHAVELSVGGELAASAPFTVTAATVLPAVEQPQQASCVAQSVSGATIQWNVKESFRTYIEGSIAKGSYSIGWGSGSGAYSTANHSGRVSYGGSATFTGHSGALDLTLSNPRIQVNSATSAYLILNVTSKGYNGSPDVTQSGVVFANLSLPAASESAARISWSNASATLTAAGAEAFAGFYSAGTALDPVSFAFPLGAEVPCDSTTDGTLAATGGSAPVDALWLGFGMLTLGAAVLVLRRRRAVRS